MRAYINLDFSEAPQTDSWIWIQRYRGQEGAAGDGMGAPGTNLLRMNVGNDALRPQWEQKTMVLALVVLNDASFYCV